VISVNIVIFLLFGALVGWLASVVMKTNSQQGLLGDIILGTLGALAGGLIMDFFGQPGVSGFNLYSIGVALVGAVLLILVGRALSRAM
jgi:uncharacterized membrane protein YeaQ/YmgE (transglycosylase-associated protein family)